MKILWIPHTGWHIPQRAHLFCRGLAERHEIHVTDWVADFGSLRDYFSRRYLRNFVYRRCHEGGITVHGIPRISPALFVPALRHFNAAIFSWFVRHLIERYSIDVVVGTFLVSPPEAPRLVFDLFDDNPAFWQEFGHNPALAKEIAQGEDAWICASDHIVTVSSVLRDKLEQRFGPAVLDRVTVIPNGIALKRYRSADGCRVRSALGLGERKVVGFISALGIFSGVIRYLQAIRLLADPAVMHLIVGGGPLLSQARLLADRYGLSNVIFTGWVDSGEVANYYAALDLGVIPFDLADFTHSACPIKLFEYVACGKPVVSTPLEEVKRLDLPGVTLAGPDVGSFADGISHALSAPRPPVTDLSRYDLPCLVEQYERILSGEQ